MIVIVIINHIIIIIITFTTTECFFFLRANSSVTLALEGKLDHSNDAGVDFAILSSLGTISKALYLLYLGIGELFLYYFKKIVGDVKDSNEPQ